MSVKDERGFRWASEGCHYGDPLASLPRPSPCDCDYCKRPRQRAVGGETNEWYTPPEIFQALDCEFDIDVAAPPGGVAWIPAARSFDYHDDGIGQPWNGRVWLNPPYGPHTGRWLAKLAEHGNGIALVFARTDVTWFQTVAEQASLVCFIRGRVRFVRGEGRAKAGHNAAAPSCLMAFGGECAEIVRRSGLGLSGRLAS